MASVPSGEASKLDEVPEAPECRTSRSLRPRPSPLLHARHHGQDRERDATTWDGPPARRDALLRSAHDRARCPGRRRLRAITFEVSGRRVDRCLHRHDGRSRSRGTLVCAGTGHRRLPCLERDAGPTRASLANVIGGRGQPGIDDAVELAGQGVERRRPEDLGQLRGGVGPAPRDQAGALQACQTGTEPESHGELVVTGLFGTVRSRVRARRDPRHASWRRARRGDTDAGADGPVEARRLPPPPPRPPRAAPATTSRTPTRAGHVRAGRGGGPRSARPGRPRRTASARGRGRSGRAPSDAWKR